MFSSDKSINLTNDEDKHDKPHMDAGFNTSNQPATKGYRQGCGRLSSANHRCNMYGSSVHIFLGSELAKKEFNSR